MLRNDIKDLHGQEKRNVAAARRRYGMEPGDRTPANAVARRRHENLQNDKKVLKDTVRGVKKAIRKVNPFD